MSKATRVLLTVMMVVCRVLDRLFYSVAYVAGWLSSVCATRYMRLKQRLKKESDNLTF